MGVRVGQRTAGERDERARQATVGTAGDDQRSVGGRPSQWTAGLVVGVVAHSQRARLEVVVGDRRRQGRQPWCGWPAEPHPLRGRHDDLHERGRFVALDVRGLERHQLVRAEAHHRPAGCSARQVCGRRITDHVDRIGGVVQPERDAQVGVGADVVADDAVGPLGGEEEVHAEAATALGDADKGVEELGLLGGHGRELVDHHEQSGERGVGGDRVQIDEVGRAVGAQHTLSAAELGVQAAQHAIAEVCIEIGDHPDDVGQSAQPVERRTTLVVDEHDREVRRADVHRQADHERAQQFALSRTGGARDETVGPVANEVEIDEAVDGLADRCAGRHVPTLLGRPTGDDVVHGGRG